MKDKNYLTDLFTFFLQISLRITAKTFLFRQYFKRSSKKDLKICRQAVEFSRSKSTKVRIPKPDKFYFFINFQENSHWGNLQYPVTWQTWHIGKRIKSDFINFYLDVTFYFFRFFDRFPARFLNLCFRSALSHHLWPFRFCFWFFT